MITAEICPTRRGGYHTKVCPIGILIPIPLSHLDAPAKPALQHGQSAASSYNIPHSCHRKGKSAP